ncbi:uncharacterized protein LOC112050428 [Bicyclus anynana]|uniref:Uncharacterized protein LOC112050428 n=1 Tax=Bicyclus anynana TaxID=110368 RepID=A0ABM3M5E9_BICAN|nr:uncharacterized protein LOC112050428 [Bicyclus anynana]
MDKKRSVNLTQENISRKSKESARKTRDVCKESSSSSHTHIFRQNKKDKNYVRITSDEYLGILESESGRSDSFGCRHGASRYSAVTRLKNFEEDPARRLDCPAVVESIGWEVAVTLKFLITDPVASQNTERLQAHIQDLATVAHAGYRVDVLDSLTAILDYVVENLEKKPCLRDGLILLLQRLEKPILLKTMSDIETQQETLRNYFGFLGYLLLRMEQDDLFEPVARAVLWQLSADDAARGLGALCRRCPAHCHLGYVTRRKAKQFVEVAKGGPVAMQRVELCSLKVWHDYGEASVCGDTRPSGHQNRLMMMTVARHALTAASALLPVTVSRMLALAPELRFPAFLQTALLLACHSVDCCAEMIKENIIENIFYRFNPYFPMKQLPGYEENPLDPQDCNVKLGASSIHISNTMSLLLVLVRTLKTLLDVNYDTAETFPCPDFYAQRCFLWAYRYECRARGRRHERMTLTVIAHALLSCFGHRLTAFSALLMPDVMSLSVFTEIRPKQLWIQSVGFNTSQLDAQFKNMLIFLSVDLLKTFPCNKFMIQSQYWLLGMMFLLDPGLSHLRWHWSPSLYAEIRKTTLQALVCTMYLMPTKLIEEYEIIRRIMWYIEWYSECPYELSLLYWCVRLLDVAVLGRDEDPPAHLLGDLFDTHGIIILMHLCYTLLEQRCPPVEKSQVVLSLAVRLLTSALAADRCVTCCVYPLVTWPASINTLTTKMLDIVLFSLDKHLLVNDRWLISLLDLIWEAIIWKKESREKFVLKNGVYNLLDVVTMSKPPVQCLALAMLCDLARAGGAVAQLITWRANLGASNATPRLVKRGATIASLLATVFREDCVSSGVPLNVCGILQELDCPLMCTEVRKELQNPQLCTGPHQSPFASLVVAGMAASRMSKAYAILQILTEDLQHKVSVADEAYNMYKNVKLKPNEETILLLCAHFLTLKLNETWAEAKAQSNRLLPPDQELLNEFLQINGGWAKEIKKQQEDVIKKHEQKDVSEEKSLYAFLAQVRLNIALDAMREVRCAGRTAALACRTLQPTPQPAVALDRAVISTYRPPLDDSNPTGQYVKVHSIPTKNRQ